MTDLISSLADSIIALINAKPQSPAKAEVDEVLRKPLTMAMDALHLASYPVLGPRKAIAAEEIKAGTSIKQLMDAHLAKHNARLQKLEDDHYRMEGEKAKRELLAAAREEIKAGDPVVLNADGSVSHWAPATLRAAQAAWRPCPGSTDGSHAWAEERELRPGTAYSDIPPPPRFLRCPCGARKTT